MAQLAGASEQGLPTKGPLTSASAWRSVHYEPYAWDPNKRWEESDVERAARFFGPPSNGWAKILLPYYEGLLTRIHEPSSFAQRTNASAREYRLLYLPSWSPPIVLRFYLGPYGPTLRMYAWTRPDAPYANEPPFMAEQLRSQRDWENFTKEVEASKFWQRASHREEPEGKDGCRFVLEALDRGRHHIVDRFGSDDDGFEKLCAGLLDWAPVEKGKYFLQLQNVLAKSLAQERRREQTPAPR